MAAGTPSGAESTAKSLSTPAISVCESRPGTSVFLEAGNTDGWIASDLTVEITR